MNRTATKLALLTSLYLSQGLPFGFFGKALPVMLREQGVSLTAISLTSLLALPWMFKFLWAPFVDQWSWQRFGRRRSWIVPLQLAAIALMLGVSLLDPERQLAWVLGAVLLTNLLAATQDIATDGLAVTLLTPPERGLGNGVQVAAYRLGMVIGGGVLLITFARLGWRLTFMAMAGVLAVSTLPILLYTEPREPPDTDGTQWLAMALELWRRPGMKRWLGLLVIYKLGEQLGGGVVTPMFTDLGLDKEEIGWMLGLAGSLAALVGALLGGWITTRVGRREALLGLGLVQASGVLAYIVPWWLGQADDTTLYALTVYDSLVGSMATAALFTAMMDACDPQQGGTDYTIQASVVVAASGIGGALSGLSADTLGYTGHFVLAAALTAIGAVLFWRWYAVPLAAKVVPGETS